MTRKEIYNKIKELNLTQMCIEVFGKNMTICKNEQLLQLIEQHTKPKQADTSNKNEKTSTNTPDKDIVFLNEYFGTNLPSLDAVDWKYVSKCQKLNDDFIIRYAKYLNWDLLTKYQNLSYNVICRYCNDNDKYIINIISNNNIILSFNQIYKLYCCLETKQYEYLNIILDRQLLSEDEIKKFMHEISMYCMEIKPQVWKRSFSEQFLKDNFIQLSEKFNMTFLFQQNTIPEYLLQEWLKQPHQSDELYSLISSQDLSTMFLHKNFTYFNLMDIIKHQKNAQAFFDMNKIIIVNAYKYLLADISKYVSISTDLLTHLIKK